MRAAADLEADGLAYLLDAVGDAGAGSAGAVVVGGVGDALARIDPAGGEVEDIAVAGGFGRERRQLSRCEVRVWFLLRTAGRISRAWEPRSRTEVKPESRMRERLVASRAPARAGGVVRRVVNL
jgi:hypothetical protein